MEKETMEIKEKASSANEEETEINYRGIKAMPFIIGEHNFIFYFVFIFNLRSFF